MTNRPVPSAQHLRAEIGRLLSDEFPSYASLAETLPDDVLEDFLLRLKVSPSGPFLDFCQRCSLYKNREVGETRLRNLLTVLPDVTGPVRNDLTASATQLRSATLSLTVSVVDEMADSVLGNLFNHPWSAGETNWVRGSVVVACKLPVLWHSLDTKERMMVFMALAGKQGNINRLIDLCRERNTLSADFVKAYFENSSAPLGDGVL